MPYTVTARVPLYEPFAFEIAALSRLVALGLTECAFSAENNKIRRVLDVLAIAIQARSFTIASPTSCGPLGY